MSANEKSESGAAKVGRGKLPPFLQSIFFLAAGSASARIITLATLPILTRLYQPEEFGALALFTSIVSIAAPVATFRFNQAIPLALSSQSAACLAALSLIGTTMLAVLLIPLGFFAARQPEILSALGPVVPYWPLVLLGIYAAVIFDIVYFAGIRRLMNKEIAQAHFARALFGTAVKLGAGAMGLGAGGLIAGQIVQLSGGSTIILRRLGGGLQQLLAKLNTRALLATARRYRAYPAVIMPSSLLVALGMQAPIFMISALYDSRTVGYFAFATVAMAVPINLLNQTIGNAFYGEISRIRRTRKGSIVSLTLKLICAIAILGLGFALVAYFTAEPIAAIILGEEWRTAGLFMSYFAIYAGAQIASSPLMQLFLLQKQHLTFAYIGSSRLFIILCTWIYLENSQIAAADGVLILSIMLLLYYVISIICVIFQLSSIKREEESRT